MCHSSTARARQSERLAMQAPCALPHSLQERALALTQPLVRQRALMREKGSFLEQMSLEQGRVQCYARILCNHALCADWAAQDLQAGWLDMGPCSLVSAGQAS